MCCCLTTELEADLSKVRDSIQLRSESLPTRTQTNDHHAPWRERERTELIRTNGERDRNAQLQGIVHDKLRPDILARSTALVTTVHFLQRSDDRPAFVRTLAARCWLTNSGEMRGSRYPRGPFSKTTTISCAQQIRERIKFKIWTLSGELERVGLKVESR